VKSFVGSWSWRGGGVSVSGQGCPDTSRRSQYIVEEFILVGKDGELEVRLLDEQDVNAVIGIAEMNNGLRWCESYGADRDFNLRMIRQSKADFNEQKGLLAGIWVDDALTGIVSLTDVHRYNRSGWLGYYLGAAYHGRGYMTRACRLMCRFAFDEWQFNRIEIPIATANAKSRAVAERLGCVQEGVLRKKCRFIPEVHALEDFGDGELAKEGDDYYYDVVMYSLLKSDWRRVGCDSSVIHRQSVMGNDPLVPMNRDGPPS
jgi:ribosomal-protein-serine acetyltransferase